MPTLLADNLTKAEFEKVVRTVNAKQFGSKSADAQIDTPTNTVDNALGFPETCPPSNTRKRARTWFKPDIFSSFFKVVVGKNTYTTAT